LTEETLAASADTDHTVLKVDRNYEYSVWISYAEVYNEKAYDLLETVNSTSADGSQPLLLTRKALAVKPSPPSDSENGEGRYIAGLRHVRVTSAAQAKAVVSLGQAHRRVFGTLANSASSRSHGLVTIKLMRGHRGERDVSILVETSSKLNLTVCNVRTLLRCKCRALPLLISLAPREPSIHKLQAIGCVRQVT
jgi:hypothetical protein